MNRTKRTRDMILCAMFATLISIGAFIKISIPVVPFTLQSLYTGQYAEPHSGYAL